MASTQRPISRPSFEITRPLVSSDAGNRVSPGSDRLSFGSADRLWQYLGVRPGSVCPFCIINDTAGEVEIILEKDMLNAELVNYHPMENHLTVGLTPDDLLRFIESCDHKPRVVDLKDAAPDEEN